MACEDGRRMLLQNLHNHVPGYTVLYQDLIMNPHQYKQLTSCTKNIKNNWNLDGNDILRKVNYRREVRFLQAAFDIMYFFL